MAGYLVCFGDGDGWLVGCFGILRARAQHRCGQGNDIENKRRKQKISVITLAGIVVYRGGVRVIQRVF